MYNRYQGNSGRVVRVKESAKAEAISAATAPREETAPLPQRIANGRPSSGNGGSGGLGSLLNGLSSKINLKNFETEDLILMLILFLMYRESGDIELLIALGSLIIF